MRIIFALSLAFALTGCDDPHQYAHENDLEEQLEADDIEADDPAELRAPAAGLANPETASDHAPIEGWADNPHPTLGSCTCYTTCSSNGDGWTKTYKVGSASSATNCSNQAVGFCKALSSSYKYHNSACT